MSNDTQQPLSATAKETFLLAGTATICTALYKRGLRNVFIQGVSRLNNKPVRMVGPAYTLRYIPAREDLDGIEVFKDPKHPQRLGVESVPEGSVFVMDCREDATTASAGNILATRLQVRGCAGIVSDGGLRDAESMAELDMPVFCAKPSAPTNLTKHHGLDLNVPIGCGKVPVYPGDIMVGDGDGVVVVPAEMAEEIALEVAEMEVFEAFVLERVQQGETIIGLYPATKDETLELFNAWRRENNK